MARLRRRVVPCYPGRTGLSIRTSAPIDLETPLADPDGDGLVTAAEELLGTDPLQKDSDGDGVDDYRAYLAGKVTLDRW